MKVEWVVMVDEDGRVNRLGGVVERGGERRRVCKRGSGWSKDLEVGVEGGRNDWGEVVTR